jgi:signal transduction histidine kinase
MTDRGLDVAAASAEGRLILLDAAETLARFMVDGSPDPERFAEVVGGLVAKAARGRKRLRAFGEMVALLWDAGNRAAAVRLEELWNDLGQAHKFALFCAYPMKALGGEAARESFGRVCACHTRVLPAEGYATLPTADARAREIARLQQQAASLEAEVARRKAIEEELREQDRRKDEFLATLGHELRNPLAPLRNALEILRMTGASEPIRGIMERQIHSLERLVDDLLQVSRVTRGQLTLRTERVDLAAVVRTAVETSRPGIDAAGHTLAVTLPADPLPLDGDPLRLTQIFANLLNNAAKYTDDGGRIDLVVARDGDEAVVRVRDTGVGIPADMLPRVFDLFTQVDRMNRRSQSGLGIGLALVKSLVSLHGGRVEAASDGPERGSEFTVRLPLGHDSESASEPKS